MFEAILSIIGKIYISLSKGAMIGGISGLVHESYIVIKQKKRKPDFFNFFIAIAVSAFIGYFVFEIGVQMEFPEIVIFASTFIFSLHSFVFFQILINPNFLLMILVHFIPKLDTDEIKNLQKKLEKNNLTKGKK